MDKDDLKKPRIRRSLRGSPAFKSSASFKPVPIADLDRTPQKVTINKFHKSCVKDVESDHLYGKLSKPASNIIFETYIL